MLYGVEQVIYYKAWNKSTNNWETGDEGNHSLYWNADGSAAAATNSPSEVDATNQPGRYKVTITATEFQCLSAALDGKSSTSNVVLIFQDVSVERLPNVAPGATGGLALQDDLDLVESRLTADRAGFLDNLDIGENVAGTSEVTSIQNNTRCVRVVPSQIENPDSSTTTYRIELMLYDDLGNMEAPDSAPTITLVNQAGTDRSSRLDSTTMTLVSTGRYRAIYTATAGDTLEQLNWTFSVVEGGNTRLYGNTSNVVDVTLVGFSSADQTKLNAIHAKLPSKSYLTGTANSDGDIELDEATGGLASDALDNISTTAPSGVASNFREMLVQTWRRFFKKATITSTELKTYADDDTTAITTQTVSDDGTTQTQGAAS